MACSKMETLLVRPEVCGTNRLKESQILMEQRVVSLEYLKWMVKLLGFQSEIQYRPSLENKAADGLSRICHPAQIMALTVPKMVQMDKLANELKADARLQKLIRDL